MFKYPEKLNFIFSNTLALWNQTEKLNDMRRLKEKNVYSLPLKLCLRRMSENLALVKVFLEHNIILHEWFYKIKNYSNHVWLGQHLYT